MSMERGREYLLEGRIHSATLMERTLTATCTGSRDIDYEMRIHIGRRGIDDYLCTCPRGDFCKHLVALALFSIEKPQEVFFLDERELRGSLASSSNDELVGIILDHARTDIEFAKSLSRFTKAKSGDKGIRDASFPDMVREYRKTAERRFRGGYESPYRAASGCAAELRKLIFDFEHDPAIGSAGRLAFATAIYECLEDRIGEMDDSDGELGGVAWSCSKLMAVAAEKADLDAASRACWLSMVLPRYIGNEYGLGDGLGEAILVGARSENLPEIERTVRASLSTMEESKSDFTRRYRTETACELLAELFARAGRGGEIARLYTDAGLHFLLAMHLYAEGDLEAAMQVASNSLRQGYDIKRFCDALLKDKRYEQVKTLLVPITSAMSRTEPYRKDIIDTLAGLYELSSQFEEALELRSLSFLEDPSLEDFKAGLKTAKRLKRESEYRERMIRALSGHSGRSDVLVRIHIFLKDVDSALSILRSDRFFFDESLVIDVAKAAGKTRQSASSELYMKVIGNRIERMGRDNYRDAAVLIKNLREVMPEKEFRRYVDGLLGRYRNRPAFKDELAGSLGKKREKL
jgi:uncharacterized Zn finger protein